MVLTGTQARNQQLICQHMPIAVFTLYYSADVYEDRFDMHIRYTPAQ